MSANISAILGLFPKHGSSTAFTPISSGLIVRQQHDSLIDPVLLKKLSKSVQEQMPNLWHGKWQKMDGDSFGLGYDSQSDADLALAGCIARVCVNEGILEEQLFGTIESVFNLSEQAKREKWQNRQDYRTRTINKVMEGIQPCDKLITIEDSHGDVGNAIVFAQQWRGKMLFVVNADKWLRWTDQGWNWCYKEEQIACAKLTARYCSGSIQYGSGQR